MLKNLLENDLTHLLELRIIIRSRVFLLVSKEMAEEISDNIDWIASEVYCCNTNGATAWTWCCKDNVSVFVNSMILWFKNALIWQYKSERYIDQISCKLESNTMSSLHASRNLIHIMFYLQVSNWSEGKTKNSLKGNRSNGSRVAQSVFLMHKTS